jgi:hypothetical protein
MLYLIYVGEGLRCTSPRVSAPTSLRHTGGVSGSESGLARRTRGWRRSRVALGRRSPASLRACEHAAGESRPHVIAGCRGSGIQPRRTAGRGIPRVALSAVDRSSRPPEFALPVSREQQAPPANVQEGPAWLQRLNVGRATRPRGSYPPAQRVRVCDSERQPLPDVSRRVAYLERLGLVKTKHAAKRSRPQPKGCDPAPRMAGRARRWSRATAAAHGASRPLFTSGLS